MDGPTGPDPEPGCAGADDADPDALRFDRWRRHSTAGVIMTGVALGLQQALERPKQEPAFVIQAAGDPPGPPGPIELRFDPDDPAGTVAVIRTWLAEDGTDAPGAPG